MRFVTCEMDGTTFVGVMPPEGDELVPVSRLGFAADEMQAFIRELTPEKLAALPEDLKGKKSLRLSEVRLLSPIVRPEHDVVCLGLNYAEHAAEAEKDGKYGRQRGETVYFAKRVDEAVAPGGAINAHADICDKLDYEVELAAVLSRTRKTSPQTRLSNTSWAIPYSTTCPPAIFRPNTASGISARAWMGSRPSARG